MVLSNLGPKPVAYCVSNAVVRAFVRRPELTPTLRPEHAVTAASRRQRAPAQAPTRALYATDSDCSAVRDHRKATQSP